MVRHVDAHRSTGYVVDLFKRGKVVSTRYATINMLRTMEIFSGSSISVCTMPRTAMTDVFDVRQGELTYSRCHPRCCLRRSCRSRSARPDEAVPVPRRSRCRLVARRPRLHFVKRTNDRTRTPLLWEGTNGRTLSEHTLGLDLGRTGQSC